LIFVDPRIGSADLVEYIPSALVQEQKLDFGDVMFFGDGPKSKPVVRVGIELKKLSDLLNCISDKRFVGHQMIGMVNSYDERWLVIEGVYRTNPASGLLEILKGKNWVSAGFGPKRWLGSALDKFLMTIRKKAGIQVWNTANRDQTAQWIMSTYRWWEEGYDSHTSHLAIYDPIDTVQFDMPNVVVRVAAQLGKGKNKQGLGYKKAYEVAEHFSSLGEMFDASVEEWQRIPGIGKELSKRIWEELHK